MIYTDKKIKFYGNLEDLLYTTKKLKIPKGDSSLEIIDDAIAKKQFENQEKELNKYCNINIYDVMKNYQNGNVKALDVLFKWSEKYNKVDFAVPALKSMLIRCINTNKSTGLENVKKIYDETSVEKPIKRIYKNQKCKGWKKRYVQPVEPEFIEQLITQTLIEIFKNEPSECPEDLDKIKNYEKKGTDNYEITVDGKPIAQTVKYIMSNNDISSEKDIYDELKYRVTTILTQTFTRTEGRIKYTKNMKLDDFDLDFDEEVSNVYKNEIKFECGHILRTEFDISEKMICPICKEEKSYEKLIKSDEDIDIDKSKKKESPKYIFYKYETSDIATIHASDDDEYNLHLSDIKVAKDYMTTQLNVGYQDVYAYILSNIKVGNLIKTETFIDESGKESTRYVLTETKFFIKSQKEYIEFFLNCEGSCYKLNKRNHYILDEDAVAKKFGCKDESNVSQIIKGIAEKILKYLDLDMDYEYKVGTDGSRELIRKNHINNYHLRFKAMYIYSIKQKIHDLYCKRHYSRDEMIKLSKTPIFKELIEKETDCYMDTENLFFEKMYLGEYPNSVVDIFDMYCTNQRLRDLFFDAIGENKLLANWKEYLDVTHEITYCIEGYVQGMPKSKVFNSDDYQDYEYIYAGQIYYRHDGIIDMGGERIGNVKHLGEIARKYVKTDELGDHITWANYWERNGRIINIYKWVDYLSVWIGEEDVFPIRHDNKDVEKTMECELSDDIDEIEILYNQYSPYSTQFLMDHGKKVCYMLPNKYRVFKNDKKLYAWQKAL